MAFRFLFLLCMGSFILCVSGKKKEKKKQIHEHWDYQHKDKWAQDYPDCGEIDESPINIITKDAVMDEEVCVAQFDWDIDYDQHTFKVINNAHSLQLFATEINEFSDFTWRRRLKKLEYEYLNTGLNTIATFPDYFAPQDSKHTEYCLESFHFHWGMSSEYGSEHLLDDKQYPLEAHFVHFACDDITIGNALETYETDDDPHILAVIGIAYEVSADDNPAFDAILNDETLKKIQYPDDLATEDITGYDIIYDLNLTYLIPDDLATKGYFAYEGSLTTPPCTDVVRWHMMKATSTISEKQLEKMRTLLNDEKEPIAPNYRPVQENVNGVWDCTSSRASSGKYVDSQLLGAKIPTHATSNITSVVNIMLFCAIIFTGAILMACWCAYFTKYRQTRFGKDMFGNYGNDDTCISDTDPEEPESDALIHKQ